MIQTTQQTTKENYGILNVTKAEMCLKSSEYFKFIYNHIFVRQFWQYNHEEW